MEKITFVIEQPSIFVEVMTWSLHYDIFHFLNCA